MTVFFGLTRSISGRFYRPTSTCWICKLSVLQKSAAAVVASSTWCGNSHPTSSITLTQSIVNNISSANASRAASFGQTLSKRTGQSCVEGLQLLKSRRGSPVLSSRSAAAGSGYCCPSYRTYHSLVHNNGGYRPGKRTNSCLTIMDRAVEKGSPTVFISAAGGSGCETLTALSSSFSTGSAQYDSLTDSDSRKVSLVVEPRTCLVDDNLEVIVERLVPTSPYTICATVIEGGIYAASYAHFVTDALGCISTGRMPSLSGSYTGIDTNGLLWSMDIVPGQKPGRRIMKKDVTKPYEVEFSVYTGHVNPIVPVTDDVIGGDDSKKYQVEPITKQIQHRYYKADNVKRIVVREGNIRGTLFLPAGEGPFPATIDLFGTAGGLLEFRSALLASRGIASLALAFFAYDDLPEEFTSGIHMDYFEEAVNWLYDHPMVAKRGVGVIGVSAGAFLALLCGELFPKVKAVVSINGSLVNFVAPMLYKGKVVKEITVPDWSRCEFLEDKDDAISFHDMYGDQDMTRNPNALLNPESSDSSYLMVVSGDDMNTHPMLSLMVVDRMNEAGKGDQCELLFLEKAGHLVEPPHTMLCYHSYHKAYSSCFAWGGEKFAHAKAQDKAWAKMRHFLKSHLAETQKSKL